LLAALVFLIIGLFARLPRSMNWYSTLLVLLVIVQSLLIYPPRKLGIPLISALHPVNALFIFLLPLYLAIRVRQILRASAAGGR
jgi:heme A synthase